MNVNFAFIRHGLGCHNLKKFIKKQQFIESIDYSRDLIDPVLSQIGVDATIKNGCIVSKIIRNIGINNIDYDMETINILACSPLLRSMESAYYTSLSWKHQPSKILVLPYLRELNESSIGISDKNSPENINVLNTTPEYMMKPIKEQQQYLKSLGILNKFDFSYIEKAADERNFAGDIPNFIHWFANNIMGNINSRIKSLDKINVYVITHAGVLKDYTTESFRNNSGIIVNSYIHYFPNNRSFVSITPYHISLKEYLPTNFISDYDKYSKDYICASERCSNICKNIETRGELKSIDTSCSDSTK